MPKLKCFSPKVSGGLLDEPLWLIELTTDEDRQAIRELGLEEGIESSFSEEQEARDILGRVNDRANQIRNPSFIYDRVTWTP